MEAILADTLIPDPKESRFFEALNRATRMPDSAEGVALEMTRLIVAASAKVPTKAELLDLFTICLRVADGELRLPRRETVQ